MLAIVQLALCCVQLGSRLCSGFLWLCRLRRSWLSWLRGICALAALVYVTFSLGGEIMYARSVARGDFAMLQRVGKLFPLERNLREGPAHAVMVLPAPPSVAIPILKDALAANPYSADLWIALLRYEAQAGNEAGALSAYSHVRAFLPMPVLAKAVIGTIEMR